MQTITINPSELSKVLKTILRRRKSLVVVMTATDDRFSVADARYRATTAAIPCQGEWWGTVEIEGVQFRKILDTYSGRDTITISREEAHIIIKSGGSTVSLNRLDPFDKGKIKRQPLPHKGKVVHKPDPINKRAEYKDTWKFSARVPLPKEAYKNRPPEDWDKED